MGPSIIPSTEHAVKHKTVARSSLPSGPISVFLVPAFHVSCIAVVSPYVRKGISPLKEHWNSPSVLFVFSKYFGLRPKTAGSI